MRSGIATSLASSSCRPPNCAAPNDSIDFSMGVNGQVSGGGGDITLTATCHKVQWNKHGESNIGVRPTASEIDVLPNGQVHTTADDGIKADRRQRGMTVPRTAIQVCNGYRRLLQRGRSQSVMLELRDNGSRQTRKQYVSSAREIRTDSRNLTKGVRQMPDAAHTAEADNDGWPH